MRRSDGVRFALICKTCDEVRSFDTETARDDFAAGHSQCQAEKIRLITK
jgi:hypothetical protein